MQHRVVRTLALNGLFAVLIGIGADASSAGEPAEASGMQMQTASPQGLADPTSVLMIVNRDSNDIAFMDLESRRILKSVFLGNNGTRTWS